MRWNKHEVCRLLSLMAARRRPNSWRNSTSLTLMGPRDSNASETNVVCCKSTYLSSFLVAVLSAAPPAFTKVRCRYELATVSVTSHVTLFPCCHGMRVSPSGRFPLVHNSPGDFKTDGVSALVSARYMILVSLDVLWISQRPACMRDHAYFLRQPVFHKGTDAAPRGWCRVEDPQQLWLPRCRASTRMLTAEERGANHRCWVPMLPGAELCWSCLWRPTWPRLGLPLSLVCPKCSASYHLVSPVRSCCRRWTRFSTAFLGSCPLWADSGSWPAGVNGDCGWMWRMPERWVVPAIPLDESQDLPCWRAGLPGSTGGQDGKVSNHITIILLLLLILLLLFNIIIIIVIILLSYYYYYY